MPTGDSNDRAASMIEELERITTRVQELERELEWSHRLATLGTIAGSIAHEFNNLLTPVLSYAQMALQSPEDNELVERALSIAVDRTEKAADIAGSLLGYIRDGRQETSSNTSEVLKDAVSCLARDPERDGIEIRCEINSDTVVGIRPIVLHQVFLNLLLNAINAIRPGPGVISISSTACSVWNNDERQSLKIMPDEDSSRGATGWLCLSFADNGPGIEADMVERVFNPFVKRDVSKSDEPTHHKGTGLGLAICKHLIEQEGGSINVWSKKGAGTTFNILLPAASNTDAAHKAA